jgi:hypothetical protein
MQAAIGGPKGKEKIMELEREITRSQSVENSL